MQTETVPSISVANVDKRFQAITALTNVSIDFKPGSVHVLFGENGAGKSTLINILSGVHAPSAGHVSIAGKRVAIANPEHARALGVSSVFQEPALVPTLSIAENLSLGRETVRYGFLQRGKQLEKARAALDRVGCTLPVTALVSALSRAEHQIIEIARALQDEAQVLILDEPTAALTDDETNRLFDIIRQLRAEKLAIIYITHRMGEIRQIGDEVSILRDGALVRTTDLGDITDQEMVTLMTGRQVDALFPSSPHAPMGGGLELIGISSENVHDVNLRVERGEIVGVTGLVGSGKADIGEICFGLRDFGAGRIRIDGAEAGHASPGRRLRDGMIYYPADRKKHGLIGVRPARENVTLSSLEEYSKGWFLDRRKERAGANDILRRLSLRPHEPEALPTTFSGGNQQKIVLARGFNRPYSIHVFDEPTAGVDVGARTEIYEAMCKLAESGAAVLIISSDLPEIVNLVHRAHVMAQGHVVGEFSGDALTESNLLPYFFHETKEMAS